MTCCYTDHSDTFECTQPEAAVFTEADREMLKELHAGMTELKALLAQVEPLIDSFMGGNGAPRSPMNMILGSFMGGGR